MSTKHLLGLNMEPLTEKSGYSHSSWVPGGASTFFNTVAVPDNFEKFTLESLIILSPNFFVGSIRLVSPTDKYEPLFLCANVNDAIVTKPILLPDWILRHGEALSLEIGNTSPAVNRFAAYFIGNYTTY